MARQDSQDDGLGDPRGMGADAELGAETDAAAVRDSGPIDRVRVRRERLNTEGESERSGERGSLVSYFRDIADIPTLAKEQEVLLAKEIEAATLEFREGVIRCRGRPTRPSASGRALRSESRATGKMCESFGSGSPEGEDLGARIDADPRQDRGAGASSATRRSRSATSTARRKLEARAQRLLKEADLSMQILGRMRAPARPAAPEGARAGARDRRAQLEQARAAERRRAQAPRRGRREARA